MIEFAFSRQAGLALLRLHGTLHGDDDAALLRDCLELTMGDEDVVIDLDDVDSIDDRVAAELYQWLRGRALPAQTHVAAGDAVRSRLGAHGAAVSGLVPLH